MAERVVTLAAVDEARLAELVQVATSDASADEVTAPVRAGKTWTSERIAWLRQFHRDRRPGIAGPAGEATWAVVVDDRVVGSVRLKRTDAPGILETGIWLGQTARGLGIGRAAMAAVLREADALGAGAVRAETMSGNAAALAVLGGLGFTVAATDGAAPVQACRTLRREGQPPAGSSDQLGCSWTPSSESAR